MPDLPPGDGGQGDSAMPSLTRGAHTARARRRRRPGPLAGTGPSYVVRSVAEVAEQPQDLQVQPDDRDEQAEGDVPGELRGGAAADGLVGHVEVEQQRERRHTDYDQAEDDRHRATGAQPGVESEQ